MFSLCFIMSCFCTIATYIVWFRIRGPCGFVFEMVLNSAENDKLETMCNYFDIGIDAHNALSDIEATKKLYELICEKFILKA